MTKEQFAIEYMEHELNAGKPICYLPAGVAQVALEALQEQERRKAQNDHSRH